eukprot:11350155-Alexandrium_andersonii.AAC.1
MSEVAGVRVQETHGTMADLVEAQADYLGDRCFGSFCESPAMRGVITIVGLALYKQFDRWQCHM